MSRRTRRAVLIVGAGLALLGVAGPVAPTSAAVPSGTLTASATETVWSQYVTLTATPTVPKGDPKPTGTVTFADESGTVGTADLANGVARLRTKALAVGSHLISATLADTPIGDPVTVTVAKAQTTTTLVSRKTTVAPGDTAWFQATVAPVAPATTTPAGSVAITVGGSITPAATVALVGGIASWRPRLAPGTHTVTAAFVATDTHTASTSSPVVQTVGTRPPAGTVDQAFTASVNGYGFSLGPVPAFHQTFTAGRTGVIDRVDLRMSGWMRVAPVTVGIVAVDGTNTPTGPVLGSGSTTVPNETMVDRVIEIQLDVPVPAKAGERFALQMTAPADSVSVERAPDDGYAGGSVRQLYEGSWYDFPGDIWFRTYVSPPTATLASSVASPVWSQYTDLTATFATYGAVAPTGTITFQAGGVDLGTATLSGGVAKLRTKALPAGANQVTATFSGDASYPGGIVDGTTSVDVGQGHTTTTLVSKRTEVLSGTAWFQAKVAPVAPATGTPAGDVEFYLDGSATPAATVPLAAGIASWRPRLADGTHTVTAVFVGSAQAAASTSAPVEQAVGTPATGPVDASNPGPGTGYEFLTFVDQIAQSFTVGRTGQLDSVTLDFPTAGLPVNVAIWSYGPGQPSSPITTPVTIQTQQGATRIVLDTPVPVQVGEVYAIVLDGSAATGDTPQVSTTGNAYGGGQVDRYDFAFGMWENRGWQDLVFSTTVRAA